MEKLTARQRRAMSSTFNLADAHARQSLSVAESRIIDELSDVFRTAAAADPVEMEAEVFEAIVALTGQQCATGFPRFPCMSASVATEIVANLLRLRGTTLHLVEPCFDNIPDILRRHGVRLEPFAHEDALAVSRRADTLFMLLPNNPAGLIIDEASFRSMVRSAAGRGCLLIFDFCFRAFDPALWAFDQYRVLGEERASFIAIEDTGKIWPTLDQKVSFIVCSPDQEQGLREIHDDILLELSPLTLCLVRRFCAASSTDRLASVRTMIQHNRSVLRARIGQAGLPLRPVNSFSTVSVEWLALQTTVGAAEIVRRAARQGAFIHGGHPFYWANPARGEGFLRIALARSPDDFTSGVDRVLAVIHEMMRRRHGG